MSYYTTQKTNKKELINLYRAIDGKPQLYVGTYGKYASGSIEGRWIGLSNFTDAEEFVDFCKEVLHGDEEEPELMFQDYMYFPRELYSESMSLEELQELIDYANLSEDDRNMMDAYNQVFDKCYDIDKVKDRLVCIADSFEQFADQQADELLMFADELLCRYFDYERWERDLAYDYYYYDNVENGMTYIFSC